MEKQILSEIRGTRAVICEALGRTAFRDDSGRGNYELVTCREGRCLYGIKDREIVGTDNNKPLYLCPANGKIKFDSFEV
ncbi:MAG: hypothetical protein AABX28_01310 [Nanoarchaeota archaeon]